MTTKLEQAARQALEALEKMVRNGQKQGWNDNYSSDMKYSNKAITALREALAQSTNSCQNSTKLVETQPQGEPVAWIHRYKTGAEQINTAPPETYVGWSHTPLYTTPPVVPQGEPVVYYAYATIKEYEELAGFSVSQAFRAGWNMARTTNSMLGINAAPVTEKREWVDLTPIELAEAFSDKGSADAGIRAVIAADRKKNK